MKKRKIKTWTDEETEYLINNYHKLGKKCAKKLGRSENSIWRKALKLGLKFGEYKDVKIPKKFTRENNYKWKGCGELSGSHWYLLNRNAKARNINIEITIEQAWDIFCKQNGKCALSGLDISFTKTVSNKKATTASLDRIDPNKGYSIENCQWVHKHVNRAKMDMRQEDFIKLCKLIGDYNKC